MLGVFTDTGRGRRIFEGILALVSASVAWPFDFFWPAFFPLTRFGLAILFFVYSLWQFVCVASPKHGLQLSKMLQGYWEYLDREWFDRFFNPKSVSIVIMVLSVHKTLETAWGERWEIFTKHPDANNKLKALLTITTLVFSLGALIREQKKKKILHNTEALLNEFIRMVAAIVSSKTRALKSKAPTITSKNTYRQVIDPKGQLEIIFKESARFLGTVFDLADDQVDITIFEQSNKGYWQRYLSHQSAWQHKDWEKLFVEGSKSCASKVLEDGKPVFVVSKKVSAMENEYVIGHSDADEDGSIFCAPVFVTCAGIDWRFVVSIVTYGKRFCNPSREKDIENTHVILVEIARRIELELTHRAIKGTLS